MRKDNMMSYSLTTKSSMTRLFKAFANSKIVNGDWDATVSINADGFDENCGLAKFYGGNGLADGKIDCTIRFVVDDGCFSAYLYSYKSGEKSVLFTIRKNEMRDIYYDITWWKKNEYEGFNDIAEKYGILGECEYCPSRCLDIMMAVAGLYDDLRMDATQAYVGAYVLMLYLIENGYVKFTNDDLKKKATALYRLTELGAYKESTVEAEDSTDVEDDVEVEAEVEIEADDTTVEIDTTDTIDTTVENDITDEDEMIIITAMDMPKAYITIDILAEVVNSGLSPPHGGVMKNRHINQR